MARKVTYRGKQLDKPGGLRDAHTIPRLQISNEKKQGFEEGQTLLINKELHWTSFDAVRKIRGMLQIKKVGHAGTLDPLATGLLIVCTGKNTKKINEYMAQEKEYTGTITLGATTPTYDLESEPENGKPFHHVTPAQVQQTLQQFTGPILQYPPIYSAIKKQGTALYELARRGETVELEARPITIHAFEITGMALPHLHFKVICSTGTYIRSLANDVGAALGCGGHLSSLCRTRIGGFTLAQAMTVGQFAQSLAEG